MNPARAGDEDALPGDSCLGVIGRARPGVQRAQLYILEKARKRADRDMRRSLATPSRNPSFTDIEPEELRQWRERDTDRAGRSPRACSSAARSEE